MGLFCPTQDCSFFEVTPAPSPVKGNKRYSANISRLLPCKGSGGVSWERSPPLQLVHRIATAIPSKQPSCQAFPWAANPWKMHWFESCRLLDYFLMKVLKTQKSQFIEKADRKKAKEKGVGNPYRGCLSIRCPHRPAKWWCGTGQTLLIDSAKQAR